MLRCYWVDGVHLESQPLFAFLLLQLHLAKFGYQYSSQMVGGPEALIRPRYCDENLELQRSLLVSSQETLNEKTLQRFARRGSALAILECR